VTKHAIMFLVTRFQWSLMRSCGKNLLRLVGFHVFTAASMKMTVFWKVEPCSLVKVNTRFRNAYCLQMMEAVRTSESSVYFHETTRHYNAESFHLITSSFLKILHWFKNYKLKLIQSLDLVLHLIFSSTDSDYFKLAQYNLKVSHRRHVCCV
jgi:hypothetical protein